MNDLIGFIGTFINFVLILILIAVQMDNVALLLGMGASILTILLGVWTMFHHYLSKRDDDVAFKKHLEEFERQTAKSFLMFSSDIKDIKQKVDKISEEQSEQKASIARLEGKIESLQPDKK